MLLYYITDRTQFPGTEHQRRELLVQRIAGAARAGIDFIQVREKDLPSRELEKHARVILRRIREAGSAARVLINSRTDIAIAAGADGVHLRSSDISPADVRRIWKTAGRTAVPVIAVSCHSEQDVHAAKIAGANFVVFGPVFGKSGTPGVGLAALRAACVHEIPVLALGGVNDENFRSCIEAGAAGVAGIRLFQESDSNATVENLRR